MVEACGRDHMVIVPEEGRQVLACGHYWHGIAGRKQSERQIGGKQLATLIKLNGIVHKIDSLFLNACFTSEAGLQLHDWCQGGNMLETAVKDATDVLRAAPW